MCNHNRRRRLLAGLRGNRLALLLFITCFFHQLSAQAQRVSLVFQQASVREVIRELSDEYGYEFIFDAALLKQTNPISGKWTVVLLDDALSELFKNQPFGNRIDQKRIRSEEHTSELQSREHLVC